MSTFTLNLKRPALISIALLSLVGLTACSGGQLIKVQETVPKDIAATSQELKLNNRHKINNLFSDGYFEIGDYAISGIKKDSTSTSAGQIGPYSQSKSKSGFQFRLAHAQSQWTVRCEVRVEGNVLKVFGLDTVSNKRNLQCNLTGAEGSASIAMREEMNTPSGEVSINQSSYSARAYTYENPHPDSFHIPKVFGFRIDNNGVNQGAIELATIPGRAWINPTLPQDKKTAMVGILAAMLIQYSS
jgi:hypothetical protein